jgi:hypothetical protein
MTIRLVATQCEDGCVRQLQLQLGYCWCQSTWTVSLLHVTCRVEAVEVKAPYSSECTADTVGDSRQGVVLQLGRKTDSFSLYNSCVLQNVVRGFIINKRRSFVNAVMNIHIPELSGNLLCWCRLSLGATCCRSTQTLGSRLRVPFQKLVCFLRFPLFLFQSLTKISGPPFFFRLPKHGSCIHRKLATTETYRDSCGAEGQGKTGTV